MLFALNEGVTFLNEKQSSVPNNLNVFSIFLPINICLIIIVSCSGLLQPEPMPKRRHSSTLNLTFKAIWEQKHFQCVFFALNILGLGDLFPLTK